MGCTEPVAIAYAGAIARQILGALPERVELVVSGNIIKNVKSVIAPHTGARKGLRTAVAAGDAEAADRLQHGYRPGRPAKQLWRGDRKDPASLLWKQRPEPGQGLGSSRVRREDEQL